MSGVAPRVNISKSTHDRHKREIRRLREQLLGEIASHQTMEQAYKTAIKGLKEDRESLRADLASVTEERDYVMAEGLFSADQIRILRAERATAIAERDKLLEVLSPFDGFPLHKWDGIGDDHVLYGAFTLGHVRKYLGASCQGLLDNSNYPEKPDSCARAALEGVTEPASPKAGTAFFVLSEFAPLPEPASLWQHKKTGGIYEIVGECQIESTNTPGVLYRNTSTGVTWVRPKEEFFDGRFEKVTPNPPR